jgi:hypothetical protein
MESRQLRSAGPIRDDRVDILGVGVSPINMAAAVATVERWISDGSRNYVCITGVHGVMEKRGISGASRPRPWSASGLRSTSWQERNVKRLTGCGETGWSGCFGCARNRAAYGAAMPASCLASSFSLSVITRAAPSDAPRKRQPGRHLANRLPGMSMRRDDHPWTARRTIAVSLPRSHDRESRRLPSTSNVVGFDLAAQGTG